MGEGSIVEDFVVLFMFIVGDFFVVRICEYGWVWLLLGLGCMYVCSVVVVVAGLLRPRWGSYIYLCSSGTCNTCGLFSSPTKHRVPIVCQTLENLFAECRFVGVFFPRGISAVCCFMKCARFGTSLVFRKRGGKPVLFVLTCFMSSFCSLGFGPRNVKDVNGGKARNRIHDDRVDAEMLSKDLPLRCNRTFTPDTGFMLVDCVTPTVSDMVNSCIWF